MTNKKNTPVFQFIYSAVQLMKYIFNFYQSYSIFFSLYLVHIIIVFNCSKHSFWMWSKIIIIIITKISSMIYHSQIMNNNNDSMILNWPEKKRNQFGSATKKIIIIINGDDDNRKKKLPIYIHHHHHWLQIVIDKCYCWSFSLLMWISLL